MRGAVNCLTLHNNRGHSILSTDLRAWREPVTNSEIFGPVIAYSWLVDGEEKRIDDPQSQLSVKLLPDSSGFICFAQEAKHDNCLLLDAYGKERLRLTVPWELTGIDVYAEARAWLKNQGKPYVPPEMYFCTISGPYVNPLDGKMGQFGVTAWIEYAGMYYFELDYHTGQFLWGKPIRD